MTKSKGGYKTRDDGKLDTGRPTKLTPETIDKLRTAFLMGCSDIEACLYADISKTALYNYQQKNPDFVDKKEQWKEQLTLKARTVIANALNNKDENTAKWYLERKRKDEFSLKSENEVNLNIKQALVEFVDGPSESSDTEEVSTTIN